MDRAGCGRGTTDGLEDGRVRSGDLVEIGRQMWQMAGRDVGLLPRVHAMEIGCMFYLLGKIARVTSAVERGDMASDDTWFDIGVYAKMVLAAREGAWQL